MTAAIRSSTSPGRIPRPSLSTNKYTMYNEGWRVICGENRGSSSTISRASSSWTSPIPGSRRLSGFFPAPSSIVAVCGRDRYAFAVGELSGVLAVDAVDPARPNLVGGTNIFRGVQNIAVDGYVYVPDRWSIRVFDATDPAKPKQGRPLTFTGGASRGRWSFGEARPISRPTTSASIPSISRTRPPRRSSARSSCPDSLMGWPYPGIAPIWPTATAASTSSTSGIEGAGRDRAGQARPGEPSGVAVRDDLACVAAGADGLIIVDIRRPEAPKIWAPPRPAIFERRRPGWTLRLCRRRPGGR